MHYIVNDIECPWCVSNDLYCLLVLLDTVLYLVCIVTKDIVWVMYNIPYQMLIHVSGSRQNYQPTDIWSHSKIHAFTQFALAAFFLATITILLFFVRKILFFSCHKRNIVYVSVLFPGCVSRLLVVLLLSFWIHSGSSRKSGQRTR